MINTEFLPDAVLWSEGMLLSPQHFQQNDIHVQALLHQRLAGLSPYAWGLRHLELDMARLGDGVVEIAECDAVMPDGLPIVYRAGSGGTALRLRLDKLPADGSPVRVCLALPPRTGAQAVPTTSIRRYEALPGQETLDEVTGFGDVVVERQRARIELFLESDVPAGYPSLPLLEVQRDAQGIAVLGAYHAPMLRLGASAFLGERGLLRQFARLRESVWEKLREMTGTDAEDGPESAVVMGAEARTHLRVAREIAACLPLMDVVMGDPLTPPSQAWWCMADLVGRMAAIGANPRPLAMDPYRHSDCIEQFQAAIAFAIGKLALINTQWDSLIFARIGNDLFARRLPRDSAAPVYIELRAGEGQTARELEAWIAQASIASEDLLPELRKRRLPGAKARMLTASEVADLGLRPDALVWALANERLDTPSGLVDCIRAGRTLAVQNESGPAPLAIILHHRKRPQGADTPAQATEGDHG